jgi:DNA-binding CsgD family transcriptional regulator/tetratricopeptide (TPR) repeat protein
MSMDDASNPASMDDALPPAREAFAARSWAQAYQMLAAADAESALDADDLVRWGMAAYLIGSDGESVAILNRAHQSCLAHDDPPGAARCAFWIGFQLINKGDTAQASGWFARGHHILASTPSECAEQGLLLIPVALQNLFAGDAATALEIFGQAAEIGDRFRDANLSALASLGRGQALLRLERTAEGLTVLDEVMVSVIADEVDAMVAGLVYCAVIGSCNEVFDLHRAQEWTEALTRWCAGQPGLIPYRGQCLVHRAEVLQLHGSWTEALAEAERARDQLLNAPDEGAVGMAYAFLGDLHRLTGDFETADADYRDASRRGHPPQPGLARLLLAQGQTPAAAKMIQRVLDDEPDPVLRCRLLPAYVDVVLEAGEVSAARGAADELAKAAERLDSPMLRAMANYAIGAVTLAEGDARSACEVLRQAWKTWQYLEVPYETARTRVLIAQSCRAVGDDEGAEMEMDAARWAFERLGAEPDLASLTAPPANSSPAQEMLTGRELEVLTLVATGKTNRLIAAELVISEKTVARHVSNVFLKLGVSSRSAATAYAYQHDLV